MNTIRVIYHLARADFLERVRRHSFLATLAATAYLGYAVMVDDIKVVFGYYRGINNSAWIGLKLALVAVLVVSLAGFYVVKNAVNRDLRTRVGQILASTPIGKLDYMLGKALSNFAVMTAIVGLLIVFGALGSLWIGEDSRLDLWALCSPFLFITLPALAFVAALALLFETIPWLRGGFGNIVYFFLFMFLMTFSFETHTAFTDFIGLGWFESQIMVPLYARLPDYRGGLSIGGGADRPIEAFLWGGFNWQFDMVSVRLYWFAVALLVVLLATLLFNRFDPARGLFRNHVPAGGPVRRRFFARWRDRIAAQPSVRRTKNANGMVAGSAVHLSALDRAAARFRSTPVILAELRLMLKGQRWWWYLGAGILLIVSLAESSSGARAGVLPFVWLWPVLVWSGMGTREMRQSTRELVFSAPHPLRRQLPALWLAGVGVALLTGSGVALRILAAGDWAGLLGFLVGALFIPTMALAMGVWSGTGKLFEAVYVVWWYIGPLHHDRPLDFMFTSPASFSGEILQAYLAATLILFAFAVVGRLRQMRA
ncbi:MAG TPA: hypothetical protein VM182_15140 [Terriglobia bacterium]|nr:hypothetical protein [Terriglobia bacterium]